MRLVFGTAKCVKESRCAELSNHTPELALFGDPVLLGTTHSLKHGAQIGLQLLSISIEHAHDVSNRHRSSTVRFQDIVHTGRQFSHFFQP